MLSFRMVENEEFLEITYLLSLLRLCQDRANERNTGFSTACHRFLYGFSIGQFAYNYGDML